MQSVEKSTLPRREGWHLLEHGLEKLVVVVSRNDGEVLARSLLKFGVEDMAISFEDDDELILDFGEEVGPESRTTKKERRE